MAESSWARRLNFSNQADPYVYLSYLLATVLLSVSFSLMHVAVDYLRFAKFGIM